MSTPPLSLGAWFRHDFIFEQVTEASAKSILEVGPGMGAMGSRLVLAAERYVAVETDEDSREIANRVLGGRVLNSLEAIEGQAPFDLVCAFEVLEHIEDDVGALRLWASHLKPGGRVILSVPAFQSQFGPTDVRAGHLRRYSPEEMEDVLRRAGLEPLEVRTVGFPIGYALQFVRNVLARRHTRLDQSVAERTGASGRMLQTKSHGWVTQALSWPIRQVQRPFTHRGTALVASARKA